MIYVLILFLQLLGNLVKWHCDYLPWCFKVLSIIINSNVCNWILIIFWIICSLFFNCVGRFCMYSSSGSRRRSVSGLWVKCHIKIYIFSVVKKFNWCRDCRKISIHFSVENIPRPLISLGHYPEGCYDEEIVGRIWINKDYLELCFNLWINFKTMNSNQEFIILKLIQRLNHKSR